LNVTDPGFLSYWLNSLSSIKEISNTNDKMIIGKNFSMHFWFISLLFYVLILFGIVYQFAKKLFGKKDNSANKKLSLLNIIIFGLLTTLVYFIFILIYPNMNWIIVPKILQVQTTYLPVMILLFCFGIYSNYRGWFIKNEMPYNIITWTLVSLIFTVLFFTIGNNFLNNIPVSNTLHPLYLLVFSLVRSFLLMSYLMLAMSIAVKYFNAKRTLINKFANVSYEVYLVHMIPLTFFQGFFLPFTMIPVIVKLLAVFILTAVTGYFIGKYTIYKFPKIAGAVLILIFLLMAIFYR
jgi:hypothetical protein